MTLDVFVRQEQVEKIVALSVMCPVPVIRVEITLYAKFFQTILMVCISRFYTFQQLNTNK